jgi:DNA-binding beta-propeller fold protein YncE
MSDAFTRNPDFTPYTAVVPGNLCRQPVDPNLVPACNNPDAEKTAAIPSRHNKQWWAQATKEFFFGVEDKLDPEKFNRVLWAGIKGDKVPYSSARNHADLRQNREQLLANWPLSQAQVVAQH